MIQFTSEEINLICLYDPTSRKDAMLALCEMMKDLMPDETDLEALAKTAGLNIDYFPTNFVVRDGLLWYVDYECNAYMDEWSFENWGIRYWSRTPEFEAHLRERMS